MSTIQAVITQERATISCNFGQVREAIEEKLAQYEGAVFTEDSKAYAKKEVAALRAEKKMFQDNLRTEKKKYMEPWEVFEAQAKVLIALYDRPITLMSGQIQAFEEARIAEKKRLIAKLYDELVRPDLREYVPLSKVYDPKWENATTSKKRIAEDMRSICGRTDSDIRAIRSMGSDAVEKALDIYRGSLDLSDAVTYINGYERQRQELMERERGRQRREEAERIRQEERQRILAEQRAQRELEDARRMADEEKAAAIERARAEAAQEVIESLIPDAVGAVSTYHYRMDLTADEKEKLEMYMDSVGIGWELVG